MTTERAKIQPTDDFWEFAGVGVMFFLILMGIGGCCALGGGFQVKFKDPQTSETTKATP